MRRFIGADDLRQRLEHLRGLISHRTNRADDLGQFVSLVFVRAVLVESRLYATVSPFQTVLKVFSDHIVTKATDVCVFMGFCGILLVPPRLLEQLFV